MDESLIIHPLNDYTKTTTHQRSEDNSSADGSSIYGFPIGQSVSPNPETTIRVNAHVHNSEQSVRTFQTLEASKLLKDQGFAGYITNELLQDEGLIKMAKDDANFIKTMEAAKFANCIKENTDTKDKQESFIKSMESSKFSVLTKNNTETNSEKQEYPQV